MKEDLLKIINHFGVRNQSRKLIEECYELLEATNDYEWLVDERGRCDTNHIAEELADVMVLIEQFKLYYGISSEEITNIFWNKVVRTLERIESGYYEKRKD